MGGIGGADVEVQLISQGVKREGKRGGGGEGSDSAEGQGVVAGIAVTDPPYLSLSARGIKFARCQYRCRQRLVPLESVNIPLYALLQLSIKRLHITSWTRLVRGFT